MWFVADAPMIECREGGRTKGRCRMQGESRSWTLYLVEEVVKRKRKDGDEEDNTDTAQNGIAVNTYDPESRDGINRRRTPSTTTLKTLLSIVTTGYY